MTESEFSTAASYYRFFASQERDESSKDANHSSNDDSQTTLLASTQQQQHQNQFWVQDDWTDHDEVQAQALLEQNLEKCSISVLDLHDNNNNYSNKNKNNNGTNSTDGNAWNQFYRDHKTNFFKDRHYLPKDYPEEFAAPQPHQQDDDTNINVTTKKALVEIGCGVGNAILPLMEEDPSTSPWKTMHGLDISREAVQLMCNEPRFIACNQREDERAAYGHVCDISQELPSDCAGIADVTTLLFCLSAMDPAVMPAAAKHVASSLKPGGVLVFRDYGRYDEAQMKLAQSRNKLLKDNFYRKHDGTKCFYFTLQELEALFCEAGLQVLELRYLRRVYGNKASGETRRRVWVHARFLKPAEA